MAATWLQMPRMLLLVNNEEVLKILMLAESGFTNKMDLPPIRYDLKDSL